MFIKKITIKISKFLDAIRFWEWQYALRQKVIAGLLFLFLATSTTDYSIVFIIYIIYCAIALLFGFLINNFSDRINDLQLDKNHFKDFSLLQLKIISIFSFTALIALPFYFNNTGITVTVIVGILISIAYSVRPIRLKERGFLGLVSVTLVQQLPFLLFYFIYPQGRIFALYMFIWLILDSFIIEIIHQSIDIDNDNKTRTHTFVTKTNNVILIRIISISTYILIIFTILPVVMGNYILPLLLLIFSTDVIRAAQLQLDHLTHKLNRQTENSKVN